MALFRTKPFYPPSDFGYVEQNKFIQSGQKTKDYNCSNPKQTFTIALLLT